MPKTMMWIEDSKRSNDLESLDSTSSGEELPIWVRGEQRWVSGIVEETTCADIVHVLLQDEESRGHHVGGTEEYHITERWRGVEQSLEADAGILDVWNAWGRAQSDVKISLRRVKSDRSMRRSRCRSESSLRSERSALKTVHPKRLQRDFLSKDACTTDDLLKLVLAQGEVIRKQLKKLRHSEHQIGFFEDKTHRARVRKHGSNYLLEAYLNGLPDSTGAPETSSPMTCPVGDKHSDSGVVTEGDSEQSNNNQKATNSAESSFEGCSSPSSQEFQRDLHDDDTSSTISEATVRQQVDLFDRLVRLNKRLLKEEEALVRLEAKLRKREQRGNAADELVAKVTRMRDELAKGACELQHNDALLAETCATIARHRHHLDTLYRDLGNEDREFEMLQTLLYTHTTSQKQQHHAKELLDTLV